MFTMNLILVGCLFFLQVAGAPYTHTIHQKRDPSTVAKWTEIEDRLDGRSVIPLSIALTQRNLEHGYEYLMDTSDPKSPSYGKHWTTEKVAETFSASEATITAAKTWLTESGISEERITLSVGRNWLRVNVTILEAESLLKTEYKIYEHIETQKRALGCDEYSVPTELRRHIDFVTPAIQSITVTKTKRAVNGNPGLRHIGENHKMRFKNVTGLVPWKLPKKLRSRDSGSSSLSWDLSQCNSYITRACIQALYRIPNGTLTLSSYAVMEFSTQSFYDYDLFTYLYNLVTQTNPQFSPTIYVTSDTTFTPGTSASNVNDVLEGNLDLQLAQGLVYPLRAWYYQVGSIDIFMDAVDASYCSKFPASHCGDMPRAHVMSISWGWGEAVGDPSQTRQCLEYMKLGLLGTTVLFASGDGGVNTFGGTCTRFQVLATGACPFITSVGATRIPNGGNTASHEVSIDVGWWSSGGGFSDQWALPSYQSSAMASYYANHAPPYTSAQYNNSQRVRGYPDIAAVGHNILTSHNGAVLTVEGTSASTPIVGGIFTLINEQRINAGKAPIGFVNPVLYANPSAMNDITVGTQTGCGTTGFAAVTGWDPVTGLGTPDYVKLLNIWMGLP